MAGRQPQPGGSCKLATAYAHGIDDAFFVPSNPSVAYITTAYFGETFLTADDLAGNAAEQPAGAGNGDVATRRIAGDPANPNRMWVVGPGGEGSSFTSATADGWNTSDRFMVANDAQRSFSVPDDVDFAGGTVLAAGDAGMVLNSIDGNAFYYGGADGAQATTGWRAAALASATDALTTAKVGAARKLKVTLHFGGNPSVGQKTKTITVKIRR